MIGSDFIPKTYKTAQRCKECGTKSKTMLVSIKNGKVKKKVCSEDCRLKFDDRFWQNVANKNSKYRKL